jgi:hypothetical protein
VIIASEQIFNEYGDLIKIKYHYDDGSTADRKIFINAGKLYRSNSENGFKQVFKVQR